MIPDKSGDLIVWSKAKPNQLDDGFIKDKKNRNDYFEKISLIHIDGNRKESINLALFAPHPLISLVRQKFRRLDANRKVERVIILLSNSGDLHILTDTAPILQQNAQPQGGSQFISFGRNVQAQPNNAEKSVDLSAQHNESGILPSDEEDLV